MNFKRSPLPREGVHHPEESQLLLRRLEVAHGNQIKWHEAINWTRCARQSSHVHREVRALQTLLENANSYVHLKGYTTAQMLRFLQVFT